ncbi:MAG: FG-GAP-like repeat-containing protein [Cyanobacteria bacterium P01_A01_bin.80]
MNNLPLNVSNLNGSNGFVVNGINQQDNLGDAVRDAGDVNGDGIDDLIIGVPGADGNSDDIGQAIVLFGDSDAGSGGTIDISQLDGSNGFVINGIDDNDFSGWSVSGLGDINGDGIDDLIVGATGADITENDEGESYVIFGDTNIGSGGSIDLSSLDGSNGFIIAGINQEDFSGFWVSDAGDVNGDDYDDIIIGAPGSNSFARDAGESYVIYGGEEIGDTGIVELSSLDGSNGFVINTGNFNEFLGWDVSNLGDINGDDYDDLIIGAYGANTDAVQDTGASYIVFGGEDIAPEGNIFTFELDGSNGFIIKGINQEDDLGYAVSSAGDINGDGQNDLLIGAPGADGKSNDSGIAYVVFGGLDIGSNGVIDISQLNGDNGFAIEGVSASHFAGYSVSDAGDVNGDDIDDLIIAAPNAVPYAESYVLYGSSGIGQSGSVFLSGLTEDEGFVINGIDADVDSGIFVSGAGDINDDGKDDIIIGAPDDDPNNLTDAGRAYVIYGFSDDIQLVAADFNGDNKADILERDRSSGDNNLWQMDGATVVSSNPVPPLNDGNWQIQDAADFNGDSKADILWRNKFSGENAIWSMDGANVISYDFIDTLEDTNWQIQNAADFNGDSKADILWRNRETGENAIWSMDGSTVISYDFIDTLEDTNWQIQDTADFNGDSKADILWRNRETGENAIWLMDGANVISYDFTDTLEDTNWQIAGAADFDGDGKADILWRNQVTGENAMWTMDGSTVIDYNYIPELDDVDWKIEGVADFGNDGRADILWRNDMTGESAIWQMNGSSVTSFNFIETT